MGGPCKRGVTVAVVAFSFASTEMFVENARSFIWRRNVENF